MNLCSVVVQNFSRAIILQFQVKWNIPYKSYAVPIVTSILYFRTELSHIIVPRWGEFNTEVKSFNFFVYHRKLLYWFSLLRSNAWNLAFASNTVLIGKHVFVSFCPLHGLQSGTSNGLCQLLETSLLILCLKTFAVV
jgi:hypothetical protein